VNDPLLRPKAERFVYEGLEHGKLKPRIDRTFRLPEVVEAHRYLESNRQIGKVVIAVA
jgi:NADPH:quinone reductase-like Zn-dependent oxidoreductase